MTKDDGSAELVPASVPTHPAPTGPPPNLPAGAEDAMRQLRDKASSDNTRVAHTADWDKFVRWCEGSGNTPLPASPELLGWYLTEKSGELRSDGRWTYAPATMARWVATINKVHALAGLPVPGRNEAIRDILRGIRRTRATPTARRTPLLTEDVRAIVGTMRAAATGFADRVAERRDSALLLMGLAGALRRSELCGLAVSDVVAHRTDGLYVTIRRSKTDRDAHGRVVTLPYGRDPQTCPVCAYRRWREVLDVWDDGGRGASVALLADTADNLGEHQCRGLSLNTTEPDRSLFRPVHRTGSIGSGVLAGQSVHSMIQRRARQAGFSPELVATLGGHSLRAGFVTQAVRNGATTQTIMTQTGHADERMVAIYSRHHAGLVGNAVTELGL